MAIKSEFGGSGGHRVEEGDHIVVVTKVEATTSKRGAPMCVVTFSTHDERTINGYYVPSYSFMKKALDACKLAAGLKVTDPATSLVGRELGIKAELGKADEQGRQFMQITGYGPKSDVTGFADAPIPDDMSSIPF